MIARAVDYGDKNNHPFKACVAYGRHLVLGIWIRGSASKDFFIRQRIGPASNIFNTPLLLSSISIGFYAGRETEALPEVRGAHLGEGM